MLNRAGDIVKHHEISNFKRLIKTNRQRGKNIAEDGLYRQGDGNTADAEACHQRGNIHPDIRQN